MLLTFRDYFDRARRWYGAIEGYSGDRPNAADAGIANPDWAHFISDARREVAEICQRYSEAWLDREEIVQYPADAEHITIDPPGSLLAYVPQSILLIEDVGPAGAPTSGAGAYVPFPIDFVPHRDRWVYIASAGYVDVGAYRVANLSGGRLRLMPRPAARQLRITYTPVIPDITPTDLTRETPEPILPAAVQEAVPVRAALNAAVMFEETRPALDRKWAEWAADEGRIARAARLRTSRAGPRYPIFTRPQGLDF